MEVNGESCNVTAIVPTHNRRNTLPRCLDSILAQTRPVDEIILVDDGSSDGTAAWTREAYPGINVIAQENQGVSAARNAGIRASKADLIALLDSDDAWLPTKIEKQLNVLAENPSYLCCHTEEKWIRNGRERPVAAAYRKKHGWIFENCLAVCAISPSTVMLHHSVFEEIGLFDESLPACEDYDMWLRIASRWPILLVDEPLIEKHGGHADQLSAMRGLDRHRIAALEKILATGALKPEGRAAAIKTLIAKSRLYAKGAERHGRRGEASRYERLASRWEREAAPKR